MSETGRPGGFRGDRRVYTFFGLEALGHQLEDPFGLVPNALPLTAMLRTAEREMLSLFSEADLPEPIQPNDNVLK